MKIQNILIFLSFCLASCSSQAMDSRYKQVEKQSVQASLRGFVEILTKEDATRFVELCDNDLFKKSQRAYFERTILFLKHCLFVMSHKCQDYTESAIRERMHSKIYRDAVYKTLESLLVSERSGFVMDTLTFFTQAFKYSWNTFIPQYDMQALRPQDVSLIWTLEMRSILPDFIIGDFQRVLDSLCSAFKMPYTDEQENRSVRFIKNKLRECGERNIEIKAQKDELALRLYDMIATLDNQQLKYCIFMLSRPFLDHRLAAYHLFFKVYSRAAEKAATVKTDPILKDLLFELLDPIIRSCQGELRAYFEDESSLPVNQELLGKVELFRYALSPSRKQIDEFLRSVKSSPKQVDKKRPSIDDNGPEDSAKKPRTASPEESSKKPKMVTPEESAKVAEKELPLPKNLDDLLKADEKAYTEKVDLIKGRLPLFQELLLASVLRLHHEAHETPSLENDEVALKLKIAQLIQERTELEAQVTSAKENWSALREEVQKQIEHLTKLAQRSQILPTKDGNNE